MTIKELQMAKYGPLFVHYYLYMISDKLYLYFQFFMFYLTEIELFSYGNIT